MTDELAFLSWPDDEQALIDEVNTVEGLDALCCVASEPLRSWSFDELVAQIGHDRVRVTEAVAHLVGKGLVEVCGWHQIRLARQTAARDATVQALARRCADDRPNVLGAIAHFSIWRIRSNLAEALVPRRPRPPSDHWSTPASERERARAHEARATARRRNTYSDSIRAFISRCRVLPQERRLLRHACAITDEITEVPVAQRLTRFGVLLLGDFSPASAQQADRLRAIAIPAWTASTDFEVHWLLQRASVRASVALIDLRDVQDDRDDEVDRFASLAREAMLPTVVVGATDDEILLFHDIVARLPRNATDEDVASAIAGLKSLVW